MAWFSASQTLSCVVYSSIYFSNKRDLTSKRMLLWFFQVRDVVDA